MTEELRRDDGEAGTERGWNPSAVPASGADSGPNGPAGAGAEEAMKDAAGKPQGDALSIDPAGGNHPPREPEPPWKAPAEYLDDVPQLPPLGARRSGR